MESRAASAVSTVLTHHRLSFFRRVSSRQQRELAAPNFVVMGGAPGTLAVDTVTLGAELLIISANTVTGKSLNSDSTEL